MSEPDGRFPGAQNDRMFNAPVTVVLIALSMPVLFFFQQGLPDMGASMAFAPADLQEGRWGGLFTAMLLHGGWTQVIMNMILVLAFGSPVARLFGDRLGPSVFLAFILACGAGANLAYAVVHWGQVDPIAGASGVVFGLVGGATRLLGGRGRVLPLSDRRVLGAATAWIVLSLIAGAMTAISGAGARFAWEINVFGLAWGLVLVAPLARLFGKGPVPPSEPRV